MGQKINRKLCHNEMFAVYKFNRNNKVRKYDNRYFTHTKHPISTGRLLVLRTEIRGVRLKGGDEA